MSTSPKPFKVVTGPAAVDNSVVGRVIELPDGSGRVETWKSGSGWVAGGASPDEFIMGRPVSSELADRLGILASELVSGDQIMPGRDKDYYLAIRRQYKPETLRLVIIA